MENIMKNTFLKSFSLALILLLNFVYIGHKNISFADSDKSQPIVQSSDYKSNEYLLLDESGDISCVFETSIENLTNIFYLGDISAYILASHPTKTVYAGSLTKKEAIAARDRLKKYKSAYDGVAFAMSWIHPGWGFIAQLKSSEFQNLIDKYNRAIGKMSANSTVSVYHIMTWKNRGQNSAYVTTDQKLVVN